MKKKHISKALIGITFFLITCCHTDSGVITGITCTKDSIVLPPGETEQLAVEITPVTTTDIPIQWSSDNTDIVTVDSNGLATAVRNGAATVTAGTEGGEFSDTCLITVEYWTESRSGSSSSAGSEISYRNSQDGFSFSMKACPGGTFPTGTNNMGEATVDTFWIAETEVTNELLIAVYQWAYDEGKLSGGTITDSTVSLYGRQLLDLDGGNIQVEFTDGRFSVASEYEDYPVVEITWYGAVLFCNWLTEMADGGPGERVYSGMDSVWIHDETAEDLEKSGFRLPSKNEWECAARYMGTVNPGYGIEHPVSSGMYWTSGTYLSGASADHENIPASGQVAWFDLNSGTAPNSGFSSGKGTHPVGTAGNEAGEGTPLSGNSNQLGLYDMSGNVREWCFTLAGSGTRCDLGGSWSYDTSYLQIGKPDSFSPDTENSIVGLRVAKSPQL